MLETTEDKGNSQLRRYRKLSVETKWQVYVETSRGDAPIVEVMRRYGIHSADLKRIREQVKVGALKELALRNSKKKPTILSPEEAERLRAERAELERTIVRQATEIMLLKKRVD